MTSDGSYAGLKRRKQTPWSVRFSDALFSRIIAIGGIGTIAAIMLVVLVLLGTAWPLFQSPEIGSWKSIKVAEYQEVGVDEHNLVCWGLTEAGAIEVLALYNGQKLAEYPSPADDTRKVTSHCVALDQRSIVLGFSDGSFQIAGLEFQTQLVNVSELPAEVQLSEDEPVVAFQSDVYEWFDSNSARRTSLRPPTWSMQQKLGDAPVLAVDYWPPPTSNQLQQQSQASLISIVGNELFFTRITRKKAMLGNKVTESLSTQRCPVTSRSEDGKPLGLAILNHESQVLIAWQTGTIDRFSLIEGVPKLQESVSGCVGANQMTCVSPLLGRETLLCGDDTGRIHGWNVLQTKTDANSDGYQLVPAHEIKISDVPIRSLSSSQQLHAIATCDDDGKTSLVFITTDQVLKTLPAPQGKQTRDVLLNPSDSTLITTTSDSLALATLTMKHPESSWRTYFGKVWYESYDQPEYVWQSSSGSEKAEAKFSLIPLVFGTLKATLYAMLVSVPLAVLAAIYSSEFLTPSTRSRIKPVIELMASLPSVVLGFIAALVIAPLLEEYLLSVLLAFAIVPLCFVTAGNLWNLLPSGKLVRWQYLRLYALLLVLPLGIGLAHWLSKPTADVLFMGDLTQWINSGEGSAVGGWMLVFTPILAMLAVVLFSTTLADWSRNVASRSTPRGFALFSISRLAISVAMVILVAWLAGFLLNAAGWDARGNVFGDYQSRNALLVGLALGFCVIPIIYTIADDALQAVPQSLRSASLACGATPWQTTMRVVVPSAMSGLFSAIMIGLGRAVGETMVVLMAAGNTPVMDWNLFNGFRTLSATLATELPEAAKGSTHFRTLFLAALLLFVMTLAVNTVAEFVRIRFRRRASQL